MARQTHRCPLPKFQRYFISYSLQLNAGLAPITVLRGPRQVGKTTLQEQIIYHLLHNEHVTPRRIFRVQFDDIVSLRGSGDHILTLCRWFEAYPEVSSQRVGA
ncbi:MAG: AAA family ATPase [Anaerolineae bacterium]